MFSRLTTWYLQRKVKKCSTTEVGSVSTNAIYERQEQMLDQLQLLNDAIAAVQKAQADAATREAKRIADLNTQIATLNAAIADLQAHPAAPDLTSQIASLQAVKSALEGQLPDPTTPTTSTDTPGAATAAAGN